MIRSGNQYTITGAGSVGSVTINPSGWTGDGFYMIERPDVDAAIESATAPRPGAHGSIPAPTYLGGLGLGFTIAAVYEASASARQTAEDTLMKVIGSMLDADGEVSFTPHGGGADRVLRNVRAIGVPKVVGNLGPYLLYGITLQSERHLVESDTETDTDSSALDSAGGGLTFPLTFPIIFTASGAGVVTVPNAGTSESYPLLTITGPISTPIITHADTGERIRLDTSIAAGETVEVDLFRKTVKAGGTRSIRSTLDVASSTWFSIPIGGVQLQLSGSNFDGDTKLTSSSRDAFRA
jgi:hypothetical protein